MASCGWKLLGLTMVAHTVLEDKYYKCFGTHLEIGGVRPLVPTLAPERLCSILTTSRSLKSKEVNDTLVQRAAVFLLMGGWMDPELKKVGIHVSQACSGRTGDRTHMVLARRFLLPCRAPELWPVLRSRHQAAAPRAEFHGPDMDRLQRLHRRLTHPVFSSGFPTVVGSRHYPLVRAVAVVQALLRDRGHHRPLD